MTRGPRHPRSPATPRVPVGRRHRPAPRAVILITAPLAIVVAVLAGCTGGGTSEGQQPTSPSAEPTPLADYGAAGMTVSRVSPCAALAEEGVARALGGEVTDSTSYASGERAPLTAGVRDVAQEAGCVFTGEGGTTAQAWTFAPPVTPGRAKAVTRALRDEGGCRAAPEAPAFGQPGVGRTCARGDRVVGSFGGLFGEAWLGCSVAVPTPAARGEQGREALLARTGEWCVQVLEAAREVTAEAEESQS